METAIGELAMGENVNHAGRVFLASMSQQLASTLI